MAKASTRSRPPPPPPPLFGAPPPAPTALAPQRKSGSAPLLTNDRGRQLNQAWPLQTRNQRSQHGDQRQQGQDAQRTKPSTQAGDPAAVLERIQDKDRTTAARPPNRRRHRGAIRTATEISQGGGDAGERQPGSQDQADVEPERVTTLQSRPRQGQATKARSGSRTDGDSAVALFCSAWADQFGWTAPNQGEGELNARGPRERPRGPAAAWPDFNQGGRCGRLLAP